MQQFNPENKGSGREERNRPNPIKRLKERLRNLTERPTDETRRKIIKGVLAGLLSALAGFFTKKLAETPEGRKIIKEMWTNITGLFRGIVSYYSGVIIKTPPIPTPTPGRVIIPTETPSIIETPTPSEVTPTPEPSPTPDYVLKKIEGTLEREFSEYLIKDESGIETFKGYLENFFKENEEVFEVLSSIIRAADREELRFINSEEVEKRIKELFPDFGGLTYVGTLILNLIVYKSYPLSIEGSPETNLPIIFPFALGRGPFKEKSTGVYYFPFIVVDLSQAQLKSGEVAQLVLRTSKPKGNLNNGFLIGFAPPTGQEGISGFFIINTTLPSILGSTDSDEDKIIDFDFPSGRKKILVFGEKTSIILIPPLEKKDETLGIIKNPWIFFFYSLFGARLILRQVFNQVIVGAKLDSETSNDLKNLREKLKEFLNLVDNIEEHFKNRLDELLSLNIEKKSFIIDLISEIASPSDDKIAKVIARIMALGVPDRIKEQVKELIFERFFGDLFTEVRGEIGKIIERLPESSSRA